LQLGHEGDARVFDTPDLLRIILGIGHQRRFAVDLPAVHAIEGAGSAQMRQAAPVFDAAQQQSRAILQQGCARIEHAVDGVRPVLAREDGVARVAQEQGRIVRAFDVDQRGFGSSHHRPSNFSGI
jgi:hypothetical protein